MSYEVISDLLAMGGRYLRIRHTSSTLRCDMVFGVFLPPQASDDHPVPVLYWLSGLTCTDENFMQKAGAMRMAAKLGLALVVPDTSPRGEDVADALDGAYDLGLGAGFYLNATEAPWQMHYQMFDYITEELPELVKAELPVTDSWSISGHSMGGHGAMMIALRYPQRFKSVSAFSPIVNPMACPWGRKAFSHYLGDDESTWQRYDSCYLMAQITDPSGYPPLLIDQGDADNFLLQQLLTENLDAPLDSAGYSAEVRMQPGYDHSYFFIASFIDDHLHFHAEHLGLLD
ncbi:S-formylglutathione hydrolase [Corallincola holothuriorum]|uniref:S-formylglutathione hydrolase n=1 Tax=Corallincola holothuriorum TaxID=2282215 RepID=A0A368N3K6_9GAMM|nr:S-formylglutathione hydrolase [Corallincola holothuriorum]RCU44643.1 S-formylglutathione hydrolase [Corallincola holothuriorum]